MYLKHLILIVSFFSALLVIASILRITIIIPQRYKIGDTFVNISLGIGNTLIGIVTIDLVYAIFECAYNLRVLDGCKGIWGYISIFLIDDFCYYIFYPVSYK